MYNLKEKNKSDSFTYVIKNKSVHTGNNKLVFYLTNFDAKLFYAIVYLARNNILFQKSLIKLLIYISNRLKTNDSSLSFKEFKDILFSIELTTNDFKANNNLSKIKITGLNLVFSDHIIRPWY